MTTVDTAALPHLTFVETRDWVLLFVNERLVAQAHLVSAKTLSQHMRGQPFTFEHVDGYGTRLEKQLSYEGQAPDSMTLAQMQGLLR